MGRSLPGILSPRKDRPISDTEDEELPDQLPIPLYPEGPLRQHVWDEEKDGQLTEANLKVRYRGGGFHVRPSKYPVGARFKGKAEPGLCFVLRGACRLRFPEPLLLKAGEYAALPGGEYELRVLGKEPVEMVRIWEVTEGEPPGPVQLPPPE